MAAGSPLGLLLVWTEAGAAVAISTGTAMAVMLPDETATGSLVRIWAEACDNDGNVILDAAPQITIWTLDDTGARDTVSPLTTMSASAGEAFSFDWTPTDPGDYVIQVAGEVSASPVFATVPLTVRAKFDPIALALHDVLVARM